jgi:hypothetical protein
LNSLVFVGSETFSVSTATGKLVLKAALDYEATKDYQLIMTVTDTVAGVSGDVVMKVGKAGKR